MAVANSHQLSFFANMIINIGSRLPDDLAVYLTSIDDCERRVIRFVDGLTDNQACWRPAGGRGWSVAQCVDHIAATNSRYLSAMKKATVLAKMGHQPLKAGGWFSHLFVRKTEPPVSIKVKAPRKITPKAMVSVEDALDNFTESNDDVRDFVRTTSHLDLCSVRFTNPFVPVFRFTVATGLLIVAAHTRRHLWQAEKVVECVEFPAE